MLRLIKVQGQSMAPQLHDGDYVFISRLFLSLKVGDVVVVDHFLYGIIIKKVVHVAPDGQLWLCGEHPTSLESERIGWLSPRRVLGKVIGRVCSSSSQARQAR